MNGSNRNANFEHKYQVAIQLVEKAKKRLAEGDANDALAAARKSLEFFLKDFCKDCGLPVEDNSGQAVKSEELINSLKGTGLFDEKEISLFHSVRKLGNVGVHDIANLDEAQEAVELLEKAVAIFATRDDESRFAENRVKNNVPARPSNYYDPKRKYMGEWAFCRSREDLLSIPEYAELYQKAEQGDISAMLNLAIGFLPRKERLWGSEQIICMPRFRSYCDNRDTPVDKRYYYWIVRACNQAVILNSENSEYPQKYIATALLEALKFELHRRLQPRYYISVITDQSNNQLSYGNLLSLANDIYGRDCFQTMYILDWAVMLLDLGEEHGFESIDPLHTGHRSAESIRFILAAIIHCIGPMDSDFSCNHFDLPAEVTMEFLSQIKPADGSCDGYYEACLERDAALQAAEEENARRAAERLAREEAEREATAREAAAQKAKEEAALAQEAERKARVEAQITRKKRRRRILCCLLLVIVACSVYAKKTGYEVNWSELVPDALEERFQIETLDPFADLEVRIIGADPNIRVELWNNSLNSYMQEVSFAASQTEGVEEGNSIKIVANYNKMDALKAGYRLEPTTMTYTIDQVDHYTQSCTEIEGDVWNAMYTQAADMVETYVTSTSATALLDHLDAKCSYVYSYTRTQGTPELERVFFLNQKPGFSKETYNMCYLIIRVPLTLTYNDSAKSVHFDDYGYFTVGFSNLLDEPDGTTIFSLSDGSLVGDPRNNVESIYNKSVRIHKSEYTVEEISGEEIVLMSTSEGTAP